MGANVGFAWSFVAAHVSGPYYLEVPADGPPSRAPALLTSAVTRVVHRHPHALAGPVPRVAIPPPPTGAPALLAVHDVAAFGAPGAVALAAARPISA